MSEMTFLVKVRVVPDDNADKGQSEDDLRKRLTAALQHSTAREALEEALHADVSLSVVPDVDRWLIEAAPELLQPVFDLIQANRGPLDSSSADDAQRLIDQVGPETPLGVRAEPDATTRREAPMEYRAQVEIDVEAEDPTEAAMQAYEILRDPAATPWVIEVWPHKKPQQKTLIDLEEVFREKTDDA